MWAEGCGLDCVALYMEKWYESSGSIKCMEYDHLSNFRERPYSV